MSVSVDLPALGESVVEGTVSRWLVQEGETVAMDQPLVEVTTDKVDAEIPSPAAGVLEKILVGEGETVEVGAQLAIIGAGDGAIVAPSQPAASAPASAAPAPASGAADELRATPVARRVADERSVDIREVEATGVAGRVTKADVMRHAASEAAPPAPPAAAPVTAPQARQQAPAPSAPSRPAFAQYDLQDGDKVIPMSPQRRLIAEHMVYSKQTSPHVGTVAEVDMGGIVALRNQHKKSFEQSQGFKLTFLPFIVHATVRALREVRALNASVIDGSIIEKQAIHIGVAVETEKGLVVPVVRHADRLSLSGLAAAINDLSTRARSKKLSPDDLRGGTFTVSNPGRQGNLYGFAIINQPQVGILRMGEMIKRPVVRTVVGEDAIVIRPMMHVALSYDHRAVDGAPANSFLYRVREELEEADFDL